MDTAAVNLIAAIPFSDIHDLGEGKMDVNYLGGLWVSLPENRPESGPGWSQATYQFTANGGFQMNTPPSLLPEATQPQNLNTNTLPPLNTILSGEAPSSFPSSFLFPRLRRHHSHNREPQQGTNTHSHNSHLAATPLRRTNLRRSVSLEHTPVSRPASTLSCNSEEASVSTLPPWPSQFQESFIDLTADSSPVVMPSENRKRPALGSHDAEQASASSSKRLKVEDGQFKAELKNVAELDLRDVEDEDNFARVLEEQRIASVRAQHEEADKPVSFSNLQCIICMEPMTNITVTHCGKLFD